MAMDVKHALTACEDLKTVRQRLQVLEDVYKRQELLRAANERLEELMAEWDGIIT